MASLHAIVRNGRFYMPEDALSIPRLFEKNQEFWKRAVLAARSESVKMVNVQSVYDDIQAPNHSWNYEMLNYFQVRVPITPPYPEMWIEARGGQRVAAILRRFKYEDQSWRIDLRKLSPEVDFGKPQGLVGEQWVALNDGESLLNRIDEDKPTWIVYAVVFVEVGGSAMFASQQVIWLDHDGHFKCSFRLNEFESDAKIAETNKLVSRVHTALIVNSLARFNCQNVTLNPVSNGKKRTRRESHSGGTVWHVIEIKDVRQARPGTKDNPDGKHVNLRSHWVRGHYADYRAGSGLFGKLKGAFWVSEHRRGNEEAGNVEADYRISKTQ